MAPAYHKAYYFLKTNTGRLKFITFFPDNKLWPSALITALYIFFCRYTSYSSLHTSPPFYVRLQLFHKKCSLIIYPHFSLVALILY